MTDFGIRIVDVWLWACVSVRSVQEPSPAVMSLTRPQSEIRNLLEWLCLGLAAPLLLFPGRYVLVGAGLIAVPWVVRRLATGRWSVPTAAHGPAVLLLLALAVSLLPSVRLEYSTPKFWGLVLGLATFYACLHTCRSAGATRWFALLFLGGGAALALVGLVGMATPPEKVFGERELYAALPRLVASVQSSTIVTQGFHSNEVAGVLTLFAPVAVALVFARGWMRAVAFPTAVLVLVTLLLTQSRAGIGGVVLALVVGAVWRGGKRGVVVAIAGLGLASEVALTFLGADRLSQAAWSDAPTAATVSLAGRVELWRAGLTMLLDMPLTGIGLNTYPLILEHFYPPIHRWAPSLMPHAHNLYLQIALDLGLPGLAAFLAIVALAVRGGFRISDFEFRIAQSEIRNPKFEILAVGLLLGLLAHGIYSLVDAVTLGAKPGPALWAVLGVLVAMGAMAPRREAGGWRVKVGLANPTFTLHPPAWLLWPGLGLGALLLLAAPLGVNAARLALHHELGIADFGFRISKSAIRNPQSAIPDWLAWGPYYGRAWAARALAARAAGDAEGELAALGVAAEAAPWDVSLAMRLGDLRLARGDRAGAAEAWRSAGAVDLLLERGRVAQSGAGLDWFALAQAVDPTDWRPYAAAAEVRFRAQRVDQAVPLLAEALRLRGANSARAAVAARLSDPLAALPRDAETPTSRADGDLFARASQALASRGDLAGALYAAQLATLADPTMAAHWSRLAELWQRAGQRGLAREAQLRAAELRR